MRICDNGIMRDATAEEIREMNRAEVRAAQETRVKPLTESEVSRLLIAAQINSVPVDDNTALRMLEFYPEWMTNVSYPVGHKVRYNDKLWRVIQAHTSQNGWEPTLVPSLWEQICETHSGALEDPIPYEGNMVLTAGLYYHQDYIIYRCIRDTENPVYHTLSELVGIYVEVA